MYLWYVLDEAWGAPWWRLLKQVITHASRCLKKHPGRGIDIKLRSDIEERTMSSVSS